MKRGTWPAAASVHGLEVVEATRPGPGFVRVGLAGDDAFEHEFVAAGFDQWFRLFLPRRAGEEPVLPAGGVQGWYGRWKALPEAVRPVCRNYTVRAVHERAGRRVVEVDFVLHRGPFGALEGAAAAWADRARPGERVGFLDQGRIVLPPPSGPIVVVSDATGLPALEGLAASLGTGASLAAVVGVEHEEDRRSLPGVQPRWVVGAPSDERLLAALPTVPREATAFAFGSDALGRAAKARFLADGVPEDRIDCCQYWRRAG